MTSFQRGWLRGFVRGLTWPGTADERQVLAGNVRSLSEATRASIAVPVDPVSDWSGEELRAERDRIFELIELRDYEDSKVRANEHEREQIAWARVPEGLRHGLRAYLDEHQQPGHFLCALLASNLSEAMGRADTTSRAALFDIVSYLYNWAPAPAWGSKQKLTLWLTPAIPLTDVRGALGPELVTARADDGYYKTACPRCGGAHPVHEVEAEPGIVRLADDGSTKRAHRVQFIYCHAVHLELVGVEGRELP